MEKSQIEDPRAEEALEFAIGVVRVQAPLKDKLAAARMVLDFTKTKPAAKSDVTVHNAEQFLDDVAAEMESNKSSG